MDITPARFQNLLIYCGIGLLNILALATAAALAAGNMPGFREGEFFHAAEPEAIALLAVVLPIFSTYLAANQPSFGGEGLAAQASVLRSQGHHRDDMLVVSPDDAVAAIASNGSAEAAFTPTQVEQLTAALLRHRDAVEKGQLDDQTRAEGRH